jgi:hypothetical protein
MTTSCLTEDELVGPRLVEALLNQSTISNRGAQTVPELLRRATLSDALQLINFVGFFRHNSCAPTDPVHLKSITRSALLRLNDGAKLCISGLPAIQASVDEISLRRASLHRQVRAELVADRFNRWIRRHTNLHIAVMAPGGLSKP